MSENLKDVTYWVGHAFTVIATIIGVYLAATVGFSKALELEIIRADRGTYYLSESLYSELTYNIDHMQSFIDNVGDNPFPFKEHFAGIAINSFVLDAAKFNDSALEIEPSVLRDVSLYYFMVGTAIDNYYASGQASPASLYSKLTKAQEMVEENEAVLRLRDYTDALKASVESRGVDLSQPEF